jgi:hypothetical protein
MKPLLKIVAIVLGVAGISITLLFQAQVTKSQTDYMALLQSLRGTNITKIVLSDDKGLVLDSITAPVALDAFARAANTVEPYSPNHPEYTRGYFIEMYLADGQEHEFGFHTMPSDQTIYVDFVKRTGAWTSYYGNCKSAALFDWLKKQTPISG